MRKCVDYLNGCVADTIDLRGDLLNHSWYNNHLSFNQLMPKIELMFIRKQNVMLEQLNNDHDYCVKRAMLGIVNRLSQSAWRAFNKTVKNIYYILYYFLYHFLDYILYYLLYHFLDYILYHFLFCIAFPKI